MKKTRQVSGGKGLPHAAVAWTVWGLIMVLAWAGWHWASRATQRSAGEALFMGQQALSANIDGHVDALPVEASRCVNCHALGEPSKTGMPGGLGGVDTPGVLRADVESGAVGRSGAASSAAVSVAARYGPNLHAAGLTGAVARRGGPPSRYDEASFCQLLRKGIDPAWVQIPRAMPRYTVSSAQCRDLWAFLQSQ